MQILIVDDDQDILESFDAALQAEGALTMKVPDGNAAVAAVQEDPPDIVVLDMMLPKRSGFLVLEKIKGFEDSPLVIMVTANEGKRHQAYAESLGVDAYLLKPVPLEMLTSIVRGALGQGGGRGQRRPGGAQTLSACRWACATLFSSPWPRSERSSCSIRPPAADGRRRWGSAREARGPG